MTTDKARSLTEQIEASVNQLASETDEARQSELFKNWLNTMAQFHRYSWGNQLLIAFQRPANSFGEVAGFHAWRKLGRHVKKGAKGIAILAPCVYRRKADENEDGGSVTKSVHGFRTTFVFSESDTDGSPLPTLTCGAESGGDELLSRLEWVTEEDLNIVLDYEEIREPGVEGYSAGGRIVIRTNLSPTAKAGVVVHELTNSSIKEISSRRPSRKTDSSASSKRRPLPTLLCATLASSTSPAIIWRHTKSIALNSNSRYKPSVQQRNSSSPLSIRNSIKPEKTPQRASNPPA
jgi:hypothetical protein